MLIEWWVCCVIGWRLCLGGGLCWLGDHVPIMASVYEVMGMPNGQTDYMIWGTDDKRCDGARLDMEVENLGILLLQEMGLVR